MFGVYVNGVWRTFGGRGFRIPVAHRFFARFTASATSWGFDVRYVHIVIGQTVVAPDTDFEKAGRVLLKEMEAEWEKDWSEL